MNYSALIEQLLEGTEVNSEITEDVLSELYHRLRSTDMEAAVWEELVFLYKRPLPKTIAYDLIDRNIALIHLGHTKQEYEVMWKLAELVDEALLTLASDIYTQRNFSLEETEILFDKFHGNTWMLETLIRKNPSSPEKRKLLESAILKNKDSARLHRLINVLHNEQLARRTDLSSEEFYFLFMTNEPTVWLALSQNPNTPVEILSKLLVVEHMNKAKRIRHAARLNLSRH
ncbi:hypothetical protein [Paenibacillus koleovorans]|uniref:hypothetical protein n=1 Tax=Paenibacillus koleovorans TaxID=121608 RepID=UPI000FD986AA|nr:hypothetical protein [Paenibacillus koleovorans]